MRETLKFTNFYQEMMILKAIEEKINSKYTNDDFIKMISDSAKKNGFSAEKNVSSKHCN